MEAILAFFKKIGLPGVIAAIVSAVVTMIPFLFQIDERYAKADDLEKQITTVTKQINDLTIEVGRLAGTQQVLVSIMSVRQAAIPLPEQKPTVVAAAPTAAPAAAPIVTPQEPSMTAAPPVALTPPERLFARKPATATASPAVVGSAAPEPVPATPPKSAKEERQQLDAVSRALEHTQRRVQEIQKY